MGRLTPTPATSTLRNALGPLVYYTHKRGTVYRSRVTPTNTVTPSRTRVRTFTKNNARAWASTLTAAQRLAWNAAALKRTAALDRHRQKPLSGWQYFHRVNHTLQNVGSAIATDPPAVQPLDFPTDLQIGTLDADGPSIDLEVFGADGPNTALIIYASPSLELDQLYFQKYRRQIAVIAPAWTNPIDITSAWQSEFGTLPPGGRVGFEVASANTIDGRLSPRLADSALTTGTGNAMQLIQSISLSAPAATIDFASIPQSFRHLYLLASLRSDAAALTNNGLMHFNGDGTTVYSRQGVHGYTSSANGDSGLSQSAVVLYYLAANSAPTNVFSPLRVEIPRYTSSTNTKTGLASFGNLSSLSAANNNNQLSLNFLYDSTAPITSLTLTPAASASWMAGSSADLYGIS